MLHDGSCCRIRATDAALGPASIPAQVPDNAFVEQRSPTPLICFVSLSLEPAGTSAQVPDVARVALQADDAALIIASDGLWDVVTDQEASDIVRDVLEVRLGNPLRVFHALAPTATSLT